MTYTREWTVRFSDLDVFGIAHYPRIVDAVHETADMYMADIGWPFWRLVEEEELGLPIVDVGAEFLEPLDGGDTVTMTLESTVGDASVRFEYTGHRGDEVVLRAYEQRVCVPVGGESAVQVPAPLRSALESDGRG